MIDGAHIAVRHEALYFGPFVARAGLVIWRVEGRHIVIGTKPDERGQYRSLRMEMSGLYKREFELDRLRGRLAA